MLLHRLCRRPDAGQRRAALGVTLLCAALLLASPAHPQPATGNAVADQAWREIQSASEQVQRGQALRMIEPMRRAQQTLEQQLGPAHSTNLLALHSLSIAYNLAGQQMQQLAVMRRLCALTLGVRGPVHEQTLAFDFILASLLKNLGQLDEARRAFESLVQRHAQSEGPTHPTTITMRSWLASVLLDLGLLQQATDLQRQVVDLSIQARGLNDRATITLRNNLANSYISQGRIDEGLALLSQAAAGALATYGPTDSDVLYWTGQLASRLASYGREPQRVRELRQAELDGRRASLERMRAQPGTTASQLNYAVFAYGIALSTAGQHEQALDVYSRHRQALQAAGDASGVAEFSANMAIALDELGRTREAVAEMEPAVRHMRSQGQGGDPRVNYWSLSLGRMHARLGQHAQALALSRERLASAPQAVEAGSASWLGELVTAADLSHRTGDDMAALRHAEDFDRIAEQARWRGGLGRSERQSMYRDHAGMYSRLSILMGRAAARSSDAALRERLLDAGLRFGERAKGRTLAEGMAQRRAMQAAGLTPQELEQMAGLDATAAGFELQLAGANGRPNDATAQEAMRQAREGLDRTGRQLRELQEAIAARNPRFAALRMVRQATPADAGRLLAPDQVFVSYVGTARGDWAAWLLTPEGRVNFIDLGEHKNLGQTIHTLRKPFAQGQPGAAMAQAAAWQELAARIVLPVLRHGAAAAAQRWVISPDGELALLPFDILPTGADATARLGSVKALTLVQGWTVLALLKEREAQYASLIRPRALLSMGNAVYETSQAAAAPASRGAQSERRFATGAAGELRSLTTAPGLQAEQRALRELRWENLPGTEKEVRAVAQVFGNDADTFTGPRASEAQMQRLNDSGQLAQYRFVHLAAHGYLAANPSLSSLVLSQSGNSGANDGYITATEWPNYRLQSDLLVLSACDTGVGAVLPGEGVMGLPYALFVAGNRNTLLTLWPVDDDATAAFITRLFTLLRGGMGQAQALSAVKREFMAHPQWADPYYWAPFVMYGS